ncbi:MAG: TIM barrel protein [Chloroflexi bacterium]|nr:TIM barrel protein [Chloroflexota bacterium]
MDRLLFGTGGIPNSARMPSTLSGIERVAELGLDCMELEFVQGVRMGEKSAMAVAKVASSRQIGLTAHAPYFINLNARESEKIKASQTRLLQTARIGVLCGATSIVFHSAFYMDDQPEAVYERVKKYLNEVMSQLKKENIRLWVRPEVMGRTSQFGDIEEVLRLCKEVEGVAPGIDFAHWHARCGACNTYPEFYAILGHVRDVLGRAALDSLHLHVSGIAYGKKGEIKHLNLKESDFSYTDLLKALAAYDAKGFVICESPSLEDDALLMQSTYRAITKG